MSTEAAPSAGEQNAPAPGPSADVIQHLIDEAAYFNVISVPAEGSQAAIHGDGGIVGMQIDEVLHRFDDGTQAPDASRPLKASNRVGEPVGAFSHRWMLAPDDFVATPGTTPPATRLDPSRGQRFVMLDGTCHFGGGGDGFHGFGTGLTWPTTVGGKSELHATAVGTILEGFGKFAGHEGTYLYCGSLSPERGFMGSMMLRVMDQQGTLQTTRSLPSMRDVPDPEPGITYALLRGEAVPSDPVSPNIGPDGKQIGLIVEQGLRLIQVDCASRGRRGVRAVARLGQLVGKITAHVVFDPTSASGTALEPIPFTAYDEFVFLDSDGNKIGAFAGDTTDGRVFNVNLAGAPGIRFGGVGRILSGEGPFEGITGLTTDNSVVVFQPHVSASIYVLRIQDPEGKFATALG